MKFENIHASDYFQEFSFEKGDGKPERPLPCPEIPVDIQNKCEKLKPCPEISSEASLQRVKKDFHEKNSSKKTKKKSKKSDS